MTYELVSPLEHTRLYILVMRQCVQDMFHPRSPLLPQIWPGFDSPVERLRTVLLMECARGMDDVLNRACLRWWTRRLCRAAVVLFLVAIVSLFLLLWRWNTV